jgi:outer membrane protein OmpA-like peptidoglycan-associated protein
VKKIDMRILYLFALIVIAVAGCAGHDRVVLLPDPEGRTGAVVVKTAQGETVLDRPFQAADVDRFGRVETRTLAPAEVRQQFGQALAAQPLRPVSFTLYFLLGSIELTPESKQILELLKAELARRPAPEITVIGHTDLVASDSFNDALSLKRAEVVHQAIIQAGITAAWIEVTGRGKREPVVRTEDQVLEPRNRRVEIRVR